MEESFTTIFRIGVPWQDVEAVQSKLRRVGVQNIPAPRWVL